MKCPACHNEDTKVIDSRVLSEGMAIRRRRECVKCGFRFSTYEEVEILNLIVIKNRGVSESYSKEKLVKGLRKALEKRPISHDDFKKLVNIIERDIQIKAKKDEISSCTIGEIIMKYLKKADKVAYIRFASVYKSFDTAESFQEEVESLKIKTKK